jgi:hypothetical protein
MSRESLYKALSPDGNPEMSTFLKAIRALGLQLGAGPSFADVTPTEAAPAFTFSKAGNWSAIRFPTMPNSPNLNRLRIRADEEQAISPHT